MIKRHPNVFYRLLRTRRAASTCALPLVPSIASAPCDASDHKSLCFSLLEKLIRRRLFVDAQQVIKLLIEQASSVFEAEYAVNFAACRSLELGCGGYGALLRKLVDLGQPQLAEAIYWGDVIGRGMSPDASILNSMVVCFCKLGKSEEAMNHFDRIFSLSCVPRKNSCNALLGALFAQEKFLEAFDSFLRINNAGVSLGCWYFDVLMKGLCTKGHANEALELFDIMRRRKGRSPPLHLYKMLFYGLCKQDLVVEAESLSLEMESEGFFVDMLMYNALISGYSKVNKMKMAVRVFLRMLKTGCEPDTYTFNEMIQGFLKLGLVEKGWLLFIRMAEWGVEPNVVTYLLMINHCCQKGEVNSAQGLLNNMINCCIAPDVRCYTAVINALYREKQSAEATELYKSMISQGVLPDHVLSSIMLNMCPAGQELQLGLMILCDIFMIVCGLKPDDIRVPDCLNLAEKLAESLLGVITDVNLNLANEAYAVYIIALCQGGYTNDAFRLLDKMVGLGCRPSNLTCNSIIKCLCKEGRLDVAMWMIDHVQGYGVVPDVHTYLVFIKEQCKRGDWLSTVNVLDHMNKSGVKPNVAIYDTIIGCLSRENRLCEAERMFKRMLDAAVEPDEIAYTTMINGYAKNGRLLEACELFEIMVANSIKPSIYCYTVLISGLVRKNKIEKGCMYLEMMLQDGLRPNTVLYTSLLKHFLKKGDLLFAFRLFELMKQIRVESDIILCTVLVSGISRCIANSKRKWHVLDRVSDKGKERLFHLLQEKTPIPRGISLRVSSYASEGVRYSLLKLIQNIKDEFFMRDLYLYNGLIGGYCRAGMLEDAYSEVESMQTEGLDPNQVTFTILMDAHINYGDVDAAIKLFNKMKAPDRTACNTLLRGLLQSDRRVEALLLLDEMHERGLFPNKICCGYLLSLFRQLGVMP